MLDTIRVKFPIDPTEEHLKGWIKKQQAPKQGQAMLRTDSTSLTKKSSEVPTGKC